MNQIRATVIVLLTSIVVGCAAPYEGKYDPADGWRIATVLSTDVDNVKDKAAVDCREKLPPNELKNAKFAYVSYFFYGGHAQKVIAVADQELALKKGDKVYLRMTHCATRLIPVAQVSPSS